MDVEKLFGVYGGVYFSKSVLLGVLNAFLRCPPWCWMVCPPSRGSCLPLSPFVSHCLPSCFPLLDGVSAEGLVSLCLPWYPFWFPFVGWCVRLPEGLVSLCLPRGSCLPLSPIVPLLVSLCWMVWPPSRGSCLPLSPTVPLVSLCWMVCPPSRGSCLPLSPIVPLLFSLCWMVCPPSRGSCPSWSPIVPRLVSLCWMVCPPSRGSCLPLSPIIPLLVFLCWMVCLPSPGSCLPLSPIVPLLVSFVGWCVGLPEGLVSLCLPLYPLLFPLDGVPALPRVLSPLVSHCLPSCFPLLDSASAFPRLFHPCLPACILACLASCYPLLDGVSAFPRLFLSLSPSFSPFLFPFLGWCVCLPEVLSPPVSHCACSCFPLLEAWSA